MMGKSAENVVGPQIEFRMNRNEMKIVSGAQTGVDQGALLAAIDLGLEWGGWVPKGWRTENGTVPALFRPKMREHEKSSFRGRTRRNVEDSHATLIVASTGPLTGGTLKTLVFCQELMRPHVVVHLDEEDAAGRVRQWLERFFAAEHPVPFVLNVAGPRESKSCGIQQRTRDLLVEVLGGMLQRNGN